MANRPTHRTARAATRSAAGAAHLTPDPNAAVRAAIDDCIAELMLIGMGRGVAVKLLAIQSICRIHDPADQREIAGFAVEMIG